MEFEFIFIKSQDDIYEEQPKISYVKIYWVMMMMHQYIYIYQLHNPLQFRKWKSNLGSFASIFFFFFWW